MKVKIISVFQLTFFLKFLNASKYWYLLAHVGAGPMERSHSEGIYRSTVKGVTFIETLNAWKTGSIEQTPF